MVNDEDALAADLAYWQELADLVPGWRVMGWTYRNRATYITPGHWTPDHEDTINLTGRQRDDLILALTLALALRSSDV